MKKLMVLLLVCMLSFSLCGCKKAGDVSNAVIAEIVSEIYSKEDFETTYNLILEEFGKNYTNCSLVEIKYVGDEPIKNDEFISYRVVCNAKKIMAYKITISYRNNDTVALNETKTKTYTWVIGYINDNWQSISYGIEK